MLYEKMSKTELLDELNSRGISCFDEQDDETELIEALYVDDDYETKFPMAERFSMRRSEY